MNSITVVLNISSDEYLKNYQGASTVYANSIDGRTVAFPALLLRSHITHTGITGLFELIYDDNNKFVALNKISD